MKKNNVSLVALAFAIVASVVMVLAGCADNRTPTERLMGYIEKNGGTGSAEASVGLDLPVSDGDTSCKLLLSKEKLTLTFSAPQSKATSALKSEATTTMEVDLNTGKGTFLHESSLEVAGSWLNGTSSGSFDATTLTKGAAPTVTNVSVSNEGGSVRGKPTDQLKQAITEGLDSGIECFSAYLEKSGTGVTLADFGFAAY